MRTAGPSAGFHSTGSAKSSPLLSRSEGERFLADAPLGCFAQGMLGHNSSNSVDYGFVLDHASLVFFVSARDPFMAAGLDAVLFWSPFLWSRTALLAGRLVLFS